MSGFSFGPPSTTTGTTGGFSFAAPKTTAALSTFGQSAPTTAALSTFGQSAPTTAALSTFGQSAPTTATLSTFGQSAPTTATLSTFGQAAPTTATGGLSFGAPATCAPAPTLGAGNLTFGAPTTTTTAAPPSFGFGATTTTTAAAPTFSFGTPATTTSAAATPSLGLSSGGLNAAAAPSTSANAPSLGVGLGGLGTAATQSTPAGAGLFSLGKPATTTTASLSFGANPTTSAPAFAAVTGSFGKPAATTAAPTSFVGLGGIDVSSTQPKLGESKQDIKIKETQLPEEIARTVDAMKAHIKAQKTLSSDISRTSTSKLTNVSGEIMNLQWSLQEIANAVEANYNLIKLMRRDTAKTIQAVDMAQRTQDTPAGLQLENMAPLHFFQNLVNKYEQDLVNYKQQIELTERHMHSLTNPQSVSPEDLKRGFRQINECFISLAGRLNEIHQKVEAQKEQYINLRKYRLHDATNVFAKLDESEAKVDVSKITSGPSPFSNISAMSTFGKIYNSSAATGSATTGQTPK